MVRMECHILVTQKSRKKCATSDNHCLERMALFGSPILVIDSGVGGLTVVRALRRTLPHEALIYFGDTARVPYGSKSGATVTGFVRQIIECMREHDPKHIVIACNTATALSLQALRVEFPELSISGVIEPGAKAAAVAAGAKRIPTIAVIATEATVRSRAYEHAIARRRQHARVYAVATPLLAPIIEEGRAADDPLVKLALEQYLAPVLRRGIDVLVLGCTHYPLLKEAIQEIAGPAVRVIDSADWCAEDVARRLQATGTLRGDTGETGTLRCFVTDDSPRFVQLANRFLGFPVEALAWVPPEDLYRLGAAVPA